MFHFKKKRGKWFAAVGKSTLQSFLMGFLYQPYLMEGPSVATKKMSRYTGRIYGTTFSQQPWKIWSAILMQISKWKKKISRAHYATDYMMIEANHIDKVCSLSSKVPEYEICNFFKFWLYCICKHMVKYIYIKKKKPCARLGIATILQFLYVTTHSNHIRWDYIWHMCRLLLALFTPSPC